MPGWTSVNAAALEKQRPALQLRQRPFCEAGIGLKTGQGGLLLEVSDYSGDVLISNTGTVSRSAAEHGECDSYIPCSLLIAGSLVFLFHFPSFSLFSFPPLTHTHTPCQAFRLPRAVSVGPFYTAVSQEGKQTLRVRLKGARADATSETTGKLCVEL